MLSDDPFKLLSYSEMLVAIKAENMSEGPSDETEAKEVIRQFYTDIKPSLSLENTKLCKNDIVAYIKI